MELKMVMSDEFRCKFECFTINGIKADEYDFGKVTLSGDERLWGCCHTFKPYNTPQERILDKYGITRDEYYTICDKLTDVLKIYSCGCCS